jgi:cardiolipin synthase A/B
MHRAAPVDLSTTLFIFLTLAVGVPLAAMALVGFRYLTRDTPMRRVRSAHRTHEAPAVRDEVFVPTMQLVSKLALHPGHETQILTCGDETYPNLWKDLRAATRSITVQMYYSQPGAVADTFQEILCERARAGVKVLFLRDAFGAAELGDDYLDVMRSAGVEVATFRPVKWYALDKTYARSHIRIVVVDGAVAYTGGFGIDDKWLGDGVSDDQWRDTNVRFTGPAVAQHQATFAAGWAEATGDLITGEVFFPRTEAEAHHPDVPEPDGGVIAGVLHAAPTIGSTPAERFLALTIACARERLWITNAYFVPDEDFIRMLGHASQRGTDVRILTAGKTDTKTVQHASRATYQPLLELGVRIWEYQPTMIHAKTIVADGCWSGVGTMNFDNRSMAFNDETMFLAWNAGFARELEALFERDLTHSKEITLEEWNRRGWWARTQQWGAALISRIL